MIKAIVFDFAGVLSFPGSFKPFSRFMSKKTGLPYVFLRRNFKTFLNDLKLGKMNLDRTLDVYSKSVGLSKKCRPMMKRFLLGNCRLNKQLYSILPLLKKNARLYILSNHVREIMFPFAKRNHFSKYFDAMYISFMIGHLKPDFGTYEFFLKKTKLKPSECLFIDNELPNVQAAKDLGFNAMHYRNFSGLKARLRHLKLL